MRADLQNDFNLKKLVKVKSKHTGLSLFVTPRYVDHYVKHDYEPFSIEVIKRLVNNFHYFADVGAHYGYYGLVAHQAKPNVQVLAFEPVTENYKILQKNLLLHQVNRKTYNVAVSDQAGTAQFNITEASDSCGFYEHPLTDVKKTVTVKMEKLDNVLPLKQALIKIDVEGHEIKVLNGMTQLIKKTQPTLLVEFNPDCQKMASFTPADLLKKLASYGYSVFLLNEKTFEHFLYDPKKPLSWTKFLSEHDYCNVLCVPTVLQVQTEKLLSSILLEEITGETLTVADNEDLKTVLVNRKLKKEQLLRTLKNKKRKLKSKLTFIMNTDYYLLWQLLVKLFKKGQQHA